MLRCPSCGATATADARFCAQCGARLTWDVPGPEHQPDTPAERPTPTSGKQTIVLDALAVAPTARLPELPPTLEGAGGDGPRGTENPAASPDPANRWGAGDSTPTAAYAVPMIYPPQPAAAPQRSRLWLVIGLIGALGLMTIVALALGLVLIMRDRTLARQPSPVAAPTARATTAPQPTAAAQPTTESGAAFDTTLLKDSFDNPQRSSLSDGETETVLYAFVKGTYAITLKQPNYIVWSPIDGTYSNVAVDLDATLDQSNENAAGLIFRYQDDQNFYAFLISSDGRYDLELYKQNKLMTLIDWTEAAAIKGPGEPNHLRVETLDNRIRLFVNNKLLDEVSDDSFGKGELALAVTSFDKGGVTATFDNLIVRGSK